MIKSDNGNVEMEGTLTQIGADIIMVIRSFSGELKKEGLTDEAVELFIEKIVKHGLEPEGALIKRLTAAIEYIKEMDANKK